MKDDQIFVLDDQGNDLIAHNETEDDELYCLGCRCEGDRELCPQGPNGTFP